MLNISVEDFLDREGLFLRTTAEIDEKIERSRGLSFLRRLKGINAGTRAEVIDHYNLMAQRIEGIPIYDIYASRYRVGTKWALDRLMTDSLSLPNEYVLDVGCGTGTISCLLGLQFPKRRIYGFDFAPSVVEVSRQRAEKNKLKNVKFEAKDLDDLKTRKTYGLVIASGCMSEGDIDDRTFDARLDKLQRLTSPKGKLVIIACADHNPNEMSQKVVEDENQRLVSVSFPYKSADNEAQQVNYMLFEFKS